MIESPAEFNAQILAFLTGDARYLEYVETAPAAEEEYDEVGEDAPEPSSDEPTPRPGFFEPTDDTADLTPQQEEPDAGSGQIEELPNVVRRREGVFPPRDPGVDQEPHDGPHDDGAEVRKRAPRTGRSSPDEDLIPELPEELFDWPEPRDEFRYGDRARRQPPDNGEDGREAPEEPPRP
jgi:hypothetical protein